MRGCVQIVAMDLEMAPQTASDVSMMDKNLCSEDGLTERLPWTESRLAREHDILQALICAICDSWVHTKHERSLQTSPETSPAIFTVNYLFACRQQALPDALGLRLLSRGDDSHRDSEYLGDGSC